jgi:methionyl-tRNA formyltransferase
MPGASVVFFGYGPLALAGLDALAEADAKPSAVVVPGNRAGAGVDAVRLRAARDRIPVLIQPPRATVGPLVAELHRLATDVILVWSYSMRLPAEVLAVPRRGAVNVHSGLLPEYRGGHVIQWALINGEPETGVTLHYMDADIDTGPVIGQRRFPIGEDDDAVSVREKLKASGGALLKHWWPRIADGTAPRTPQDESRARRWPMRRPEEGLIDLSRSAASICRLVRALRANDPGAYLEVGGHRMSIKRAVPLVAGMHHGMAGLRMAARDADILVSEAQLEGRLFVGTALEDLRALVSQH